MHFGYGYLNIASALFGLAALILPVCAIARDRGYGLMSVMSFCMCSVSLLMQIMYGAHLVDIGDWSAIEDTWTFLGMLCLILFVCVLSVNVVEWIVYQVRSENRGK